MYLLVLIKLEKTKNKIFLHDARFLLHLGCSCIMCVWSFCIKHAWEAVRITNNWSIGSDFPLNNCYSFVIITLSQINSWVIFFQRLVCTFTHDLIGQRPFYFPAWTSRIPLYCSELLDLQSYDHRMKSKPLKHLNL